MTDAWLLLIGLIVLVKAADLLITGSSSLALRFGISAMTVGLTIVSMGTSMPELLVSLTSGLQHRSDLAIANVIGSNIFNVLVVLGIAAIIRPLPVGDSTITSEIPFSLTAALLVGFLANASLFASHAALSISRLDGAILLFFFILFMLYVYRTASISNQLEPKVPSEASVTRSTVYILLGIVGLYFGARWVVTGAVAIAEHLQVDDALIGLTVVAIGTSVPELVASAVAAYRGQTDIAVGNVVGSNIFNLLFILGTTASIVELPFDVVSNFDLVMVIASSAMILVAMVVSRKTTIQRSHGVVFLGLYLLYLGHLLQRI